MNALPISRIALALSLLFGAAAAQAGNYGVSPLDVQFSAQQKSAVLTVTSEDKEPISLRLRAMRWTQNDKGEDYYEEASDLIFFPKRLELKAGDKKIVRVGVNEVPASAERAYRLFLEELAPPTKPGDGVTRLSVLVNIGVPVFVSPPAAKPGFTIERASVEKNGSLQLQVSNKGNSRLRLSRIVMADGTPVSEAIPSRYVFPGVSKAYEIAIPRELCRDAKARLRVEAENANADADVALPAGCNG